MKPTQKSRADWDSSPQPCGRPGLRSRGHRLLPMDPQPRPAAPLRPGAALTTTRPLQPAGTPYPWGHHLQGLRSLLLWADGPRGEARWGIPVGAPVRPPQQAPSWRDTFGARRTPREDAIAITPQDTRP